MRISPPRPPGNEEDRPASETGGGTNKTNVLHERTPKRTVRQVYAHIAQQDRDRDASPDQTRQYMFACGQFEGGAELEFARNFNSASCQEAVAKLHGEIDKSQPSWRNSYAEPFPAAELGEDPTGDTTTVDTCGLSLEPQLGLFSLQRIEHGQWVITGHEGC